MGALVFSKEAPDMLWGIGHCLWSLAALPALMVWDCEGCLHAGGGRPTDVYAGFCGRLAVDWYFCGPGDAPAKGCVERLQGYLESNLGISSRRSSIHHAGRSRAIGRSPAAGSDEAW